MTDAFIVSPDPDEPAAARALKMLAGLAEERGLERLADLGDLPPLDVETATRFLDEEEMRLFLADREEAT
jgi:hypothetical protein